MFKSGVVNDNIANNDSKGAGCLNRARPVRRGPIHQTRHSLGMVGATQHKTWAQEIVAMLDVIYHDEPENTVVKYYMGSVLSKASNYRGRKIMTPEYEEKSLLEQLYMQYDLDVLALPTDPRENFFPEQKDAFDSFGKQYFSYSAPTSMGKSFLMRVYIEQQIRADVKKNYAIIVPTKALINEVSMKLIHELQGLLEEKDYAVVTSAGSTALEHIMFLCSHRKE